MKSRSDGSLLQITSWISSWNDRYKFLALIVITILVTYYVTSPVKTLWYIFMLVGYMFSKNEALWLAVFLVTSDGFSSFLGVYSTTLTIFPGLPAVEISQLYIILSVVKAANNKVKPAIFYNKYLQVLFIYLLFSIIWGQMMGLSGGLNVYFRVIKGFIPMLLFFSIPRLFISHNMYERFFSIIFIIVLFAFAAQLFTLFTGKSPLEAGGLILSDEQEEGKEFRVFYSVSSALLGIFGALYTLARRAKRDINRILPMAVVFASLIMAILSATRGWIISFSLIIILSILFTRIITSGKVTWHVILIIPVLLWGLSNPEITKQLEFARERLETIGAISEGDLTAQGTLQRLDLRSKRAMSGWLENPLFGWGFSDMGYKYNDGHVGNQNLLAISGIVGFILLNGFLIWFGSKILSLYFKSEKTRADRDTLLIFVFFLIGWFFIHSTSGQQFSYMGLPAQIIPQAVFFSFGALKYQQTLCYVYGKNV